MSSTKFRIQTDDVIVERITTKFHAVRLATDASIFHDCDITVEQLRPVTIDSILFLDDTEDWFRIGYAANGVFYYAQ